MENITAWILAVTSILLYNQVVCSGYSNDFEVFHASGTGGVKSQSLYPEPINNEKSPSDDRRFTRNASGPKNDYVGSHSAFVWKYFDKPADYRIDESNDEDDNNYGKANDKYQQAPDVELFGKDDRYGQAYDDYQYDRIRSMSHQQTQQNQESGQNPKNCKTVVEGEMKCSVCKDSAGNHSKSCSFGSAPTNEKYEYTNQRLAAYNSEDYDKKKKVASRKPKEDRESEEAAGYA